MNYDTMDISDVIQRGQIDDDYKQKQSKLYSCEEDTEYFIRLRKAYEQRWKSLTIRSERLNVSLPHKEKLWNKVVYSWNNGFKCAYCKKRMKIKENIPSLNSFTIEHKVPLFNSGDNSIDNLLIVCKNCNTRKGLLDINTFESVLNKERTIISGLSFQMIDFFKIKEDGWLSEYKSINNLLNHLCRRSKSQSSRKNYLQHIRSFCSWSLLNPDEIVSIPKREAEKIVQNYTDSYNTPNYSRRTANFVLTVLRTFYEVNGFKGAKALDLDGYYTPKRYRKEKQYIPQKHEIYMMADIAGSPRNRGVILTLYSSGLRVSTLCALTFGDIKSELLMNISNLKIPIYPKMKNRNPDACKYSLPYFTFICDEASTALHLYLNERRIKYGKIHDYEPLFASDYNQLLLEDRTKKFLTTRQVQKIIKSSARLAGIKRWGEVTPQSIRKSFENVLLSKTFDGDNLDPKIQEFLIGHTLPGSQDNYFDRSQVEKIRLEYSKLRFNRVVVENKYKRLRRAVAEAFEGTGEDIDMLIDDYIDSKRRAQKSMNF